MNNIDHSNEINKKILNAIPKGAINVLELGGGTEGISVEYKKNNPKTKWIRVVPKIDSTNDMDKTYELDLNSCSLVSLFPNFKFDVVIIGGALEYLYDPAKTINEIYDITSDDSQIVCSVSNMTHHSSIEKFIFGDLTYEKSGLFDNTHLRFFSCPSIFKIFLDNSWLPSLVDKYNGPLSNSLFMDSILTAAGHLGVPRKTAYDRFNTYQSIIKCIKHKKIGFHGANSFTLVVPVNRQFEFQENILKSPDLIDRGIQVVPVYNATSASEAYEFGKELATNDWILFAHQDVYLPRGTVDHILTAISDLNEIDAPPFIGFAGIGIDDGHLSYSGLVVDRTNLFSHPSASCAHSVDEFALLINKNSNIKIDPDLGWHLWATDMCLQANLQGESTSPSIIRCPIFHNSVNDYSLPESFKESGDRLLDKYPALKRIETLCGTIEK